MIARLISGQLGQNIITNYLATFWMGGLSLAFIPFYLNHLGSDQWGVVAICMAIQGFLGLLDVGLGQIMPRDIARVAGNPVAEAKVFRVFSRTYLGLGFAGLMLGQLSVPWLIEHWFNRGQGVGDGTGIALRLVLVQFMFQFANNAHVGYWNGLQAQKLANFRQCTFGTAKHVGAIILVYSWHADALAYLLPFAVVSALEWWINRHAIRRRLGDLADEEVSVADLKTLAYEAGVLALGVLIGMLVSQIDRIVLSRTVDVASFGHYVIVANLGLAFMQLQYPLMRAFFPRIVRAGSNDHNGSAWQLGLGVFLLCVLPCGLVAVVAPWLLKAWLGNPQIVAEGVLPLRLIMCAVAMNAAYHLVYQHILARGLGRLVVLINLTALLVVTPLTVLAARRYGIVAGGLSWLLGAVVQLVLGVLWVYSNRRHRQKHRNSLANE